MDATEVIRTGIALIEPVLSPSGFAWVPESAGASSGGDFASGAFVRGGRRLELSFRHSLGLITYSVGDARIPHSEYMRALGHAGETSYPGFSDDPLDGFRHLLSDLERFGSEFFNGTDEQFEARLRWVHANPKESGLAAT